VGGKRKKWGGRKQMKERGRVLAGLQNCRKLLVSLKLKMGEVCIKKRAIIGPSNWHFW